MVCYLYRGRCPRLLMVVPSRHRSACGSFSTTDFTDRTDSCPVRGRYRSKSLLLSPGLRPCSPMRMLSHVSELPCLALPICLVCPQADGKPSKQNSCPWQYRMSLHRRLLTVTLDLPGAYPLAYCPPGRCLSLGYLRGRCPRLLMVVPSRHQSACGLYFYHGFNR